MLVIKLFWNQLSVSCEAPMVWESTCFQNRTEYQTSYIHSRIVLKANQHRFLDRQLSTHAPWGETLSQRAQPHPEQSQWLGPYHDSAYEWVCVWNRDTRLRGNSCVLRWWCQLSFRAKNVLNKIREEERQGDNSRKRAAAPLGL